MRCFFFMPVLVAAALLRRPFTPAAQYSGGSAGRWQTARWTLKTGEVAARSSKEKLDQLVHCRRTPGESEQQLEKFRSSTGGAGTAETAGRFFRSWPPQQHIIPAGMLAVIQLPEARQAALRAELITLLSLPGRSARARMIATFRNSPTAAENRFWTMVAGLSSGFSGPVRGAISLRKKKRPRKQ